jgi:hypothetical protein
LRNVKDDLRASLKYLASQKDRDKILAVIASMEEEERRPVVALPNTTRTCSADGCDKSVPEERARRNGKYCSNECQYATVRVRNAAAQRERTKKARQIAAASAGRTEYARRNPALKGRAPRGISAAPGISVQTFPSIYEREMAADISLNREVPGWNYRDNSREK